MGTYQNSAEKIISKLIHGWEQSQAVLEPMWSATPVDEMAVLFMDNLEVLTFLSQAVSLPQVELFNFSQDDVTTGPIPSAYRVSYWFLTVPSHRFRIEAMVCSQGSMVHDMVRSSADGALVCVHASFKCPDEEAYAKAGAVLRQSGWECWQRCDSSYGRFSYYGNPDAELPWLLKPRLNLRDAAVNIEGGNNE